MKKHELSRYKHLEIFDGLPLISLICAIVFIDTAGYGVVVPMLPMYTRKITLSTWSTGILFASYAVALLLVSIPLGVLSDRIGRKPLIFFATFGTALASLLYAQNLSFYGLLFARIHWTASQMPRLGQLRSH